MRSFLQVEDRVRTIDRIRRLSPDTPRVWGTMSAPQMIAHLTDQMTHTLGHVEARQQTGWRRNALIRYLAIYIIPWPKGRIKGPADAFVTEPGEWKRDVDRLVSLIEEFTAADTHTDCPPHTLLGPMSRNDWGAFCWKHFDHHLRQFGV
ncbi:MAG: DUF1569 domain-containing protein [Chloracidobacterium sp.]|nr:DUF1569 domain-containing protein [Chloracidobacterium sp.]